MIKKMMIILIKDQLTLLLLWKNVILQLRKNFGITEFVYVMNITETMTEFLNLLQTTFHYCAPYWSNYKEFNLAGGETGFDRQESKLPTYWNTSFSKICLGMKIDQQLKFIVIHKQADSLYSLIADGQYRNTSLGRDKWKELIGSQGSLQYDCNKEGFNVVCSHIQTSKARIGIVGNNENKCDSCDSRIGFGTGGYPNNSNTCGNEAVGDSHIKAMRYILVQ